MATNERTAYVLRVCAGVAALIVAFILIQLIHEVFGI